MSLKIDYKNDIFAGKRKYQITNNADGTVSLDDVTDYVQEGDILSADDVNAINKAVNELQTGSDSFQEEITGPDRRSASDTSSIQVERYSTVYAEGCICWNKGNGHSYIRVTFDGNAVQRDGRSAETCVGLRGSDRIG